MDRELVNTVLQVLEDMERYVAEGAPTAAAQRLQRGFSWTVPTEGLPGSSRDPRKQRPWGYWRNLRERVERGEVSAAELRALREAVMEKAWAE